MISYLSEGIWIAKNCILLGIIVYIVCLGILLLVKKRDIQDFKSISKIALLGELLLVIYVCTILRITGIIGQDHSYGLSISALKNLLTVPFTGASIKMIALNCFLFVPYGFLVYFVFKKCNLSWVKAVLIGFFSSFFIEIFQSFIGRLPENDDLIINTVGFLVGFLIAQGISQIGNKETRKKGFIQVIVVAFVTVIALFLLSFVANGDAIQEAENAYYSGIGNNEEEIAAVSMLNIYSNGMEFDALNSDTSDYSTWYAWMGIDISNGAAHYKLESQSVDLNTIIEADKTYIEVEFANPQVFRFANNPSWEMENVGYLVFCVEDGTMWYGSNRDSLENCAFYDNADGQYQIDNDLVDDINNWLSGMK